MVTTLRILKDGTKIQTNKQGIRVEVRPDGSRVQTNLNGVRLETIPQPNGKMITIQTNPDNTKITVYPDGSRKQENLTVRSSKCAKISQESRLSQMAT